MFGLQLFGDGKVVEYDLEFLLLVKLLGLWLVSNDGYSYNLCVNMGFWV